VLAQVRQQQPDPARGLGGVGKHRIHSLAREAMTAQDLQQPALRQIVIDQPLRQHGRAGPGQRERPQGGGVINRDHRMGGVAGKQLVAAIGRHQWEIRQARIAQPWQRADPVRIIARGLIGQRGQQRWRGDRAQCVFVQQGRAQLRILQAPQADGQIEPLGNQVRRRR